MLYTTSTNQLSSQDGNNTVLSSQSQPTIYQAWQSAIANNNLTDNELRDIEKLSKSTPELINIAQLLISKIYENALSTVEQFISFINQLEPKSESESEPETQALNIIAEILEQYKKSGRIASNLTTQLCQAIKLNHLPLINWIMQLRTHLDYQKVIDQITDSSTEHKTAEHVISNTAFVPQARVIQPDFADNLKTGANNIAALLEQHPVRFIPRTLEGIETAKIEIIEMAKQNQWSNLEKELDTRIQLSVKLTSDTAVCLLLNIARNPNCPDETAVKLFKKIQSVATLYWPDPASEHCPYTAAIKTNKHELMRAMSRVNTPWDKQLEFVLNEKEVTTETIKVLISKCDGFYHIIPRKDDFDTPSENLDKKYQAISKALASLPKHAMWQYRMLDTLYYACLEAPNDPDEINAIFTETAVTIWGKKGNALLQMALFIIKTNPNNKLALLRQLLTNEHYALENPQRLKSRLHKRSCEVWTAQIILKLLKEDPTTEQLELIVKFLKRLKKYNDSKEKNCDKISLEVTSYIKNSDILSLALGQNRPDIALQLCSDFSMNPNSVIQGKDPGEYTNLLEFSLVNDEVSIDTFSKWLTAPQILLAIEKASLIQLSV